MVMDLVQTLGNAAASAANILAGAAASRIGGGAAFNSKKSSSGGSSDNKKESDDDGEAADDVANDPASVQLPFALMALNQLHGLVADKTGVQWDLITNLDSTSGKGGQLDLTGVSGSLKRNRASLEKKKTTKSSKVGKALLKSLGEAETVCVIVSLLSIEFVRLLTVMRFAGCQRAESGEDQEPQHGRQLEEARKRFQASFWLEIDGQEVSKGRAEA